MRIIMFLLLLMTTSCANKINKAMRDTKYSAYEMVGVEKRDLFKREVTNVKEEQEETEETFKDALQRLKDIYAFDGGNLEKLYNKLQDSFEESQEKASEVSESISSLKTVARDLFSEWEAEIKEIKSRDLKSKSNAKLQETKQKFEDLEHQLDKAEAKIPPVMEKFKDNVLYLKHNLNAQAISGLQNESVKIEKEISDLIQQMNLSIKEANEFIKAM